MADGKLPLSPASPGGQIEDVEQLNVPNPAPPPPGPGLIALVRQRVQTVGRLYNQISAVLDADPAANEFGLVTRGVDAAKESTLLTRVADATITARLNTLGQKLMAASAPVVIASDQSTIPISATSLPLPAGAATEATLLTRATEATLLASNVLLTAIRDRLPAALVGGRLDTNLGAWLGSTAPTVGQKLMASSVPVVIASDQSSLPVANTPTTSTASTVTQVPGTVVLTTLFLANAARRGAMLYNDGNTPWFIKLGAAASSTSFTVKLLKDVYYEVPFHYTGIITGLQSVANGNLYTTELT